MYPLYCIMILPTVHRSMCTMWSKEWFRSGRICREPCSTTLCTTLTLVNHFPRFMRDYDHDMERHMFSDFSRGKRLAKIETSMYDEHRAASVHLHLNVTLTTRKMVTSTASTPAACMLQNTEQSKDALLSIYNYRKLRREGKQPQEFTGDDKIYYEASNNRMFISQRWSFMVTPLLILLWLMLMTDHQPQLLMYIHYDACSRRVNLLARQQGNDIFTISPT